MGANIAVENRRVEGGEPVGDLVVAPRRRCVAVDVPPERAPSMIDEYPILAVIAAHAEGTTRMRGLKELRVKESDRLAGTAALLAVNGARVEIEGDDLIVHGSGAGAAGRWDGGDAYGPPHRHERAGAWRRDRAAGDGGRCRHHRHQFPRLRRR